MPPDKWTQPIQLERHLEFGHMPDEIHQNISSMSGVLAVVTHALDADTNRA